MAVSKKAGKKPAKSRRQIEIEAVKRQKKAVRKRWKDKETVESEKPGLKQLFGELKKRLSELRKAERISRKKKEQRKCRENFFKSPFEFARKVFEQPRSGTLGATKQDLEEHLRSTYSDVRREVCLDDFVGTRYSSAPAKTFDIRPPRLSEISEIVKKARTKAAPGPNGVP